jgi:redox-sensitive bicupin YhaK (pirin superfamily)
MIARRPSAERGHADHGWLDTHHTFSFANYYDPRFTGFRDLLVINEDRVQPGRGFGAHSHKDMEILTYVLEGTLGHKDSLGNGSEIRPGDVQRMSAGTGVTHSEANPSRTEPVHFLQIWITPGTAGLAPGYEQKRFALEHYGALTLIAARDGREGAVTIHQDADVLAGRLAAGNDVTHKLSPGRHAWVQVISGEMDVNGVRLSAGDGAAISDDPDVRLHATQPAHVLLFDLP